MMAILSVSRPIREWFRSKEKDVEVTIINTPKLAKPYAPYAPGIRIKKSGSVIYISGVVPNAANGDIVCKGDIAGQMRRVRDNVTATLEAAGLSFKDVIKINTYVVGDYMREYVTKGLDIEYLKSFSTPAVTLIGVACLPNEGQLIESEIMAVTS
jgi:enamine deaminase RidA (YjgF/YER057c/UK114 family)